MHTIPVHMPFDPGRAKNTSHELRLFSNPNVSRFCVLHLPSGPDADARASFSASPAAAWSIPAAGLRSVLGVQLFRVVFPDPGNF